jgi:F-box interacting protein
MTAAASNKTYAQKSLSLHMPPPQLPCDLVEEILCRLPVKQLLQLCCVCKSWNSLISRDSKFAKKHLRFSIFSHDRYHLAQCSVHSSEEFHLWKSPISSFISSEAATAALTDSFTQQLNHPLIKRRYSYYDSVSTCDGILCFRINESLALLCNPSIRKFNILLPPLNNSGSWLRYSQTWYTFVYDRFIHNYKIIALSLCSHDDKYKKEVNVHTLGTNYWRKIQDFPYHYSFPIRAGIFVSDTVNWFVNDTTCSGFSRVIVSFDLNKESYQELLQPLYEESSLPTSKFLGELRDCLCIFMNSYEFSDTWIMKEYGNEKSWTKLLRVPYIGGLHVSFSSHNKPLYIYEDNRVLMGKFVLAFYDPKNNTFKTHQIQSNRHNNWIVPIVYVESLISPY